MIPLLTLNNGVKIPALGLGVFQTPPDATAAAVDTALRAGYRHIDTAAVYANEASVGEGIRASGIDRNEIFLETKVWLSDFGFEETQHAYEKAVGKLGIDVIDLLLLHQPLETRFERTLEAYRALEKLLADGKVRAIGVSNFQPGNLEELAKHARVVPAVNQIELHPLAQQRELQAYHVAHGILTQAWSPIGGITFYPGYGNDRTSVLENPVLQRIGNDHGKSTAQIMLQWHLQQGRSAIPKSVRPERIVENMTIGDFELSVEELSRIDALDTGKTTWRASAEMDDRSVSVVIPEA